MLPPMLTTTLRLTAIPSEFALFNTWLISPPTIPDTNSQSQNQPWTSMLYPILYAVSEPIHTLILLHLTIHKEPSIAVIIATMIHGAVSFSFWQWTEITAARREYRARTITETSIQPTEKSQLNHQSPSNRPNSPPPLTQLSVQIHTVALTQSAAMLNASLLVLSQNADATRIESNATHTLIATAALLNFLLVRLGDLVFVKTLRLPLYAGQKGAADAVKQAVNLLVVLAVRGGVRVLFGFEAFAGAWGNGGEGLRGGRQDSVRDEEAVKRFPAWLSPILLVIGLVGMWFSGQQFGRATTLARAGRFD